MKNSVSPEEWQARVELAAAYRLIAHFGWDDLIFTHISMRVPGTENQFLINPYGMMFHEITASSLIRVDQECNMLHDSDYPVNPAGFLIHSCIHQAREDAHCIIHTHTPNGVAISASKHGLLPISQQAVVVHSGLSYHDYEGIALNPEEKVRLVNDLGDNNFMILRNHGLLTTGTTVADAFLFMYALESACAVQARTNQDPAQLIHVPQQIINGIKGQTAAVTKGLGGALAWPALLRLLDARNPGYDS
ncbi:class II aldolase/adducin family protein [Pseudoalteromonas sp. SSDWG2]|uniref:class II aldolase/adducin family protein n=1 Tax=Pseudoalteromonas sp. SSDWG2 TaxID=3139391 RepID=UPI003BABB5D6